MNPYALALALVLVPLSLGALVGRALRPRRNALALALAFSALALTVCWITIPFVPEVSPYDLTTVALFFALCLTVTVIKPASTPRSVIFATTAFTLVSIALLELYARSLPTPPMTFPGPDEQSLTIDRDSREFGTRAMFPEEYPDRWLPGLQHSSDLAHPVSGRRVLHLGDSMVAAGDVPPNTGFVEVLSREASGNGDHINLGVSNSGTDLHLMMFRVWLRRAHGDRVVLHLFSGNDPEEIDRPYAYCSDGPLLGPRARSLPSLCPKPRWSLTRRALFGEGPSPYPVRLFAHSSALARQLTWRFELAMRSLRTHIGYIDNNAPQWNRLADILSVLRDEASSAGVPLTVSVLPFHAAITSQNARERDRARTRSARIVALCHSLRLHTLDPLPDLTAAVLASPRLHWFQPPSPHFGVDGHRWYAHWLKAHIDP